MKLFFGMMVLSLLGLAVFFVSLKQSTPEQPPVLGTKESSPTHKSVEQELVISFNDRKYKIVWAKVEAQNTFLYPNFSEKEVAKNLFEQNACEVLINGGFYSANTEAQNTEIVPIGLFISQSETISGYRENSLFNGIFSINDIGTPRITEEVPEDSLVSAVQTGPILQANNYEHTLKLSRDKEARRMAAAVTGSNEIIFLSVHGENASFSGPKLVDMPKIITIFEEEAGLNIADAINLDGGAASAFYAEHINISEASLIGSFWCVESR